MYKLILLLIFAQSAFSGEIYFQGPCDQKPFLVTNYLGTNLTVGDVTINELKKANISYDGSIGGIKSILNTPTGSEAIEVISNTHMKAYGWCFEVNGFQPAELSDQVRINGTETIRWFFAYSTYQDGVWKDYCTPSYERKPHFLCDEL